MHSNPFLALSLTLALLGLATPLTAQDFRCRNNTVDFNRIDPLDGSPLRGFIDGAGGIDTLDMDGPSHLALWPERIRSVERIDLQNGLFDTVLIDTDYIVTTENHEVAVLTDPFDQVFVDPFALWQRHLDTATGGQIFMTTQGEIELRVRVDLDAHVVLPSPDLLWTRGGTAGAFEIMSQLGTAPMPRLAPEGPVWDHAGVIIPDLAALGPGAVTLDTRNSERNLIGIDIASLNDGISRDILLQTDDTDRLVLLQPDCWVDEPTEREGIAVKRFVGGTVASIIIAGTPNILHPSRTGPVITAYAARPGIRHLQANAQNTVDEIDLRNGGRDVLILRNTALRPDDHVVVSGDPEMDEIWVEGSSGWTLEHTTHGITLSTPVSVDERITVALAPGLALRLLPMPTFLMQPSMADLSFYPGTRDEVLGGTATFFTRGGIVRLSPNQLQGRQQLIFRNGTANTVHLDFVQPLNEAERVMLWGDAGRDHLVLSNAQPHLIDEDGALVWQISRGDGTFQEIGASGFAHVTYTE